MRRPLLALCFLIACASSPVADARPSYRTSVGFDALRDPILLHAIRNQKPSLIARRGGDLPVVILNGVRMPFEVLETIQTREVIAIERVIGDVTQVGNITTLRIIIRIGNTDVHGAQYLTPPDGLQVTPAKTLCGRLREAADFDIAAQGAWVRYCVVPYLPPPRPVPDLRGRTGKQPEAIG